MSLSGNDVLALIERTHADTSNEIVSVSTRLARFTAELDTLRQREIGVLSVLARIRMREIEGGKVSAALDETAKRVKGLLGEREDALAAVGEKLAAAERQQAALGEERVAQQAVVAADEKAVDEAEAAAQQALGADANYRAKLEAASASDAVADSAEAKATAAHADREQKGKPYEADAAVVGRRESFGGGNGQSGLADTTQTRHCHQTSCSRLQLLDQRLQLLRSTDQRRERARQGVRVTGLGGVAATCRLDEELPN